MTTIKTREPSPAFLSQVSEFKPKTRTARPWRGNDKASRKGGEAQPQSQSSAEEISDSAENALTDPVVSEVRESPSAGIDLPQRKRPETVGRLRHLQPPNDLCDLKRADQFVEEFLLEKIGSRHFSLFRAYRAMYSQARENGGRTLHFRRADLNALLGTSSSATVTRVLKTGIKLGLFEVQTFMLRSGDLEAGTYIHLRSPWQ